MIIGDSAAGKTTLLKRFADPKSGIFDPNHEATVGVDFVVRSIMVGDTKIKL